MIEFTIKTLDSKDHRFSVDDEITVQQLKEKVLEQMGVEIGLQRLIFCGRVLQDEKKLAEYGVHGKVIHMVQRAPPCVEAQMSASRDRDRERERENIFTNQGTTVTSEPISLSPVHLNHITQQQIRRLMALAANAHGIEIEEQPGPNLSPTASRLEFLRRLISEIRINLDALKTSESDEPRTFPTDDPLESTSTGEFSSLPQEVMCHIHHHRPLLYQVDHGLGTSRLGRGRRIRSMRPNVHTPPRDFGQLVAELHELDGEFAPFREIYINTLRQASDPEVNLSEDVLQRRQRTADLCAELYHSFSHAYHTVSDVGVLMAHGNSRLTSDALMRHPLPVHAHINVVQATPTRRPLNTTATGNGSGQAQPADGQEAQTSSALAGRNTTQPTVNINIQPDPVTYQVEIETAVPIPINIENVFMNGTNTNQGDQNQNRNQNQTNQSQQQNQNDAAQPNQDGQNERRQVMIEFENLLRGLGQAGTLGGVEVVMSMEEIPQVAGGANNNNAAPAMGSQPTEGGGNQPRTVVGSQMYLAQTADLLHNIVASVFRQGLVPGMEGVLHAQVQQVQGQSQNQSQTQGQRQGPGQSQAQPQAQTQAENQPQAQSQSQAPNQTPTQEPSQENQTNTEQNANANSANANQPRQQARSRGPRVHSQTVSTFNLVYDRFLPCDSLHARRQLQRRRQESIPAGSPRIRDNHGTRIQNNVETLFERFDRHATDEESLMIASIVTLREAISFFDGRTLDPDELHLLRQRLQVYMRDLMQAEYELGTQEQLTDLIFERHSEFINRIATITPMRGNVDVIASMKAVFIRFLDEAMHVLDMGHNAAFSRRCRIVFPRMFYELCGVISYCCLEGVEGLKKIYRSFLTDLIQNLDEPIRDLLHSLGMENLNAAIIRIERNRTHYPQFIRRTPLSSREGLPPQVDGPRPRNAHQGGLSSMDSESGIESPNAGEPEKPVDDSDETRDTEESLETEENEVTKDTDATQKSQDSSPMELSPEADAMQTSPSAPAAEPIETSVSENKEPVANTTPDLSTPVSATGAVQRVAITQNRSRINEDISSAQNASDNIEINETQSGDSASAPRGGFRTDAPQYGTDGNAGQCSQVNDDEDSLDWPEVTDDNATSHEPPGRVSAMHNRGRFRKELLRYPGSGHSTEANVAGASHRATPSPPLEPVGLEELEPVRVDSVRGRFRPETERQEGQSSGSASAPLGPVIPVGPINGLVTGRTDLNGRVSNMHGRGRFRPSRQPKSGSTDSANSTDDLIFVPPAHIAQHWGEEWVPAFTRDLQRQRAADPDEPYSDAYLSGMPPKKRRCVRQARPPTTLNAFITESVGEVSEPLGAAAGAELRATFREHVRSIARARAAASHDYEPRRFAATARFLNQPRMNARRSPENSSD